MVRPELRNGPSRLTDTGMEQFFMRRASAVILLLYRRRDWQGKIAAATSGNVEREMLEIESIDRLVLNIRAGRIRTFELTEPKAVEVNVID
ncbi:hypothetical protein LMG28690_04547 [Paraburkholderia caffeinilytica]|jgi:hypothetical protein|nr:hypothetical protein LMG28690_04547 [Paraburkholderia caffeinilytica]